MESLSGPQNFAKIKAAILYSHRIQLSDFETKEANKENLSVEASRQARLRSFAANKELLLADSMMVLPDELSDDDSKESDGEQKPDPEQLNQIDLTAF